MTGYENYVDLNNNKINNILKEMPELEGYYTFISSNKSPTSCYLYVNHIRNFLNDRNKSITDLNVNDFTGYMNKKKRKDNGELSTSSYQIDIYHALKNFADYLEAIGEVRVNPMKFVKRPIKKESQKTIEKRKNNYLNKDEIKTLLSIAKNDKHVSSTRNYAIILLLLNTGMRCSALCNIDMNDINLIEKTVVVTDKEDEVHEYHLADNVIAAIQTWIEERNKMDLTERDSQALFISSRNNRIRLSTVEAFIRKYGKLMGRNNLSPHKLRATYGTQLYNETRDIYFVQSCMHHASPVTTELYVRGQNDMAQKATNIISKIIDFDL